MSVRYLGCGVPARTERWRIGGVFCYSGVMNLQSITLSIFRPRDVDMNLMTLSWAWRLGMSRVHAIRTCLLLVHGYLPAV